MGIGLPDHPAARGDRAGDGPGVRAGTRQRGDREGRQPRRRAVRRDGRGAHPGDQLRDGAERGDDRDQHGDRRGVRPLAFVIRQRRARNPLYDLHVAARRTFWVAALAGIIVFGSLMGAMFISQQFLQNVLGYSTLEAGAAFLPAVVFMVLVAPRSAKLVESHGARFTLLVGYVFLLLGFLSMLLLWQEDASYWRIGIAYAFLGTGVGFAGTPASHSLTGSVPVRRAGMASGTADLQRDLGGAIMQSIFGALLTAGYASAAAPRSRRRRSRTRSRTASQNELTRSFASAADTAEQYPQYADGIIAGAKQAFLDGDQWAYTAGTIAVLVGAALVFFMFPHRDEEQALLERFAAEDGAEEPPA